MKLINPILFGSIIVIAVLFSACSSIETAKRELGSGVFKLYPSSESTVWDIVLKVLPELGLSISASDKLTHVILAEKGMSGFSWGERIAIHITGESEGQTRVEIISKRVYALNFTATDWTQPIFDRIAYSLPGESTSTALPLQGNAISGFRKYVQQPNPKAFALADGGHWAAVWGRKSLSDPAVAEEAVQHCTQRGYTNCRVYAINAEVVWPK